MFFWNSSTGAYYREKNISTATILSASPEKAGDGQIRDRVI